MGGQRSGPKVRETPLDDPEMKGLWVGGGGGGQRGRSRERKKEREDRCISSYVPAGPIIS
jgi:hypothetical protein